MKTKEVLNCSDQSDTLLEGQAHEPARSYRIQYAQDNLEFRTVEVPEPVPRGRQILACAGVDPQGGYSLFAILPEGDFEDVRLDERFDLGRHGIARFVAFQTDREFKLTLDCAQIRWGKSTICGADLYKLADVGKEQALFLEVPSGENRLITLDEVIDLATPGIERFITASKPFKIIVNGRPRRVSEPDVTFEQVVQLAFPDPQPGPNIVFSMTYRHAGSRPHSGNLGPGGVVEVKDGTVFNVTRTDKS